VVVQFIRLIGNVLQPLYYLGATGVYITADVLETIGWMATSRFKISRYHLS
jgi:hypothetical protein